MLVEEAKHLSIGCLLDCVALQCQRRGLHNTSIWLSELALSGTESVLGEVLTSNTKAGEEQHMYGCQNKHLHEERQQQHEEEEQIEHLSQEREEEEEEESEQIKSQKELMETDLLFHLNDLDSLHTSLSQQVAAILAKLQIHTTRRYNELKYNNYDSISNYKTYNDATDTKNEKDSHHLEMIILKWIVRLRRLHCVALSYFNKAEYQRCYALLDKSLLTYTRECEEVLSSITFSHTNTVTTPHSPSLSLQNTRKEEECKEEEKAKAVEHHDADNNNADNHHSKNERGSKCSHRVDKDEEFVNASKQQQSNKQKISTTSIKWSKEKCNSASKLALRKLLFTFTNSLEFLRFYALYMEGEKCKTLSTNPQRSINPHLRTLRVRLLALFKTRSNWLDEYEKTLNEECEEEEQCEQEEYQEEEEQLEKEIGEEEQQQNNLQSESLSTSQTAQTLKDKQRKVKTKAYDDAGLENCEQVASRTSANHKVSCKNKNTEKQANHNKLSTLQGNNTQNKGLLNIKDKQRISGKVNDNLTLTDLLATSPNTKVRAKFETIEQISNSNNRITNDNKSELKLEEEERQCQQQQQQQQQQKKYYRNNKSKCLEMTNTTSRYASFDGINTAELRKLHLVKQDVYLCWLMGVVLKQSNMKQEAAAFLLAAVMHNPLLWCSWEELSTLVNTEHQLEEMQEGVLQHVEPKFMTELFITFTRATLGLPPSLLPPLLLPWHHIPHGSAEQHEQTSFTEKEVKMSKANSELQRHLLLTHTNDSTQCLNLPLTSLTPYSHLENSWEHLLTMFPENTFLMSKLAEYYYVQRKELAKARQLYESVIHNDLYKLDILTDYSNLLFIQGDVVSLSALAQRVYLHDPFSAEVNFVVGNYYVAVGEHERSVLHFKRATVINPQLTPAWTLLGHAYVEVKNSAAAIEAYKTALTLNPHDYRGWYNLGQIYELLQAYPQALEYYWHTTVLRPRDPRMWSAVGNCLGKAGRTAESIQCLEKAEITEPIHSSTYPPLVKKIAVYYLQNQRSVSKGCVYLTKLIQSKATTREDKVFALPYLIQYHVDEVAKLINIPTHSLQANPNNKDNDTDFNNNNNIITIKFTHSLKQQRQQQQQEQEQQQQQHQEQEEEKEHRKRKEDDNVKTNMKRVKKLQTVSERKNDMQTVKTTHVVNNSINYKRNSKEQIIGNSTVIHDQAIRHLTIAEQQIKLLEQFTVTSSSIPSVALPEHTQTQALSKTDKKSSVAQMSNLDKSENNTVNSSNNNDVNNTYKHFTTRIRRKIIAMRECIADYSQQQQQQPESTFSRKGNKRKINC